jgi:hypothetical protein
VKGTAAVAGIAVGLALAAGAAAFASDAVARPAGAAAGPAPQEANAPYDGRFAFVRLRYDDGRGMRGGFFGYGRGRERFWEHDSPRAEHNILKIMGELTSVPTDPENRLILDADDPELFRYPVAYIVEVGYWNPTDSEALGLRTWLLKGGFLIVDDFRGDHFLNFEAQLRRVLPGAQLVPLEAGEEVFDSFFHIADPYGLIPPYERELPPVYLGVFEDNDPAKRMMVVVNYNNDLAEYWEFSDYGYYPIDLSNDAYKFGVNYVIYGLTH